MSPIRVKAEFADHLPSGRRWTVTMPNGIGERISFEMADALSDLLVAGIPASKALLMVKEAEETCAADMAWAMTSTREV